MKLLPLFLPACLLVVASGQQPAAPGHPGKAPATPAPHGPAPPTGKPTTAETGIALPKDWAGRPGQASSVHATRLADLKALLTGFGEAKADVSEHPTVAIYNGQRMDGALGENCRIVYLTPLPEAEALLFKKRILGSMTRVLAPGLPAGLLLHTYDVQAGIYNKLGIVTDSAKPQPQVVSIFLTAEGVNYYPPTPFKKIEREWHTSDYVNTQMPGPGQIDTRVSDDLNGNGTIVVNATGRIVTMLEELPPPGMVVKPAKSTPKETTTWYVPAPFIRLMLYCLSRQMGP